MNETQNSKQYSLDEEIKNSKIIVRRGRYAYLKAKEKPVGNHFLISEDQDEITVITEEKNITQVKYTEEVKWFKLLEIRTTHPFLVKGFLAKISKTIADAGLNILIISTFSKDYILIREEDERAAVQVLESIGFTIALAQS